MILTQLKDPRVRGVNVTGVEVTDDLQHARVFYVVAQGADRAEAQCGLDRAAGFLRHELRARLRLRYAAELRFVLDEAPERAARIEALLRER